MGIGELKLRVCEAIFDRTTNLFFSMSPKFILNWKEERHEGPAAQEGDQNPKWHCDYDFKEIGTDLDAAGVFSFTFLEDDDLICHAEIPIKDIV